MSLVIDASVAVKWVLQEPCSDRARALVGSDELCAPDFLMLEVAQVLARQARRGVLSPDQAVSAYEEVEVAIDLFVASMTRVPEAQQLALRLGASVYDSLYLAVALTEGAVLVTADDRFTDAAERLHPGAVRRL